MTLIDLMAIALRYTTAMSDAMIDACIERAERTGEPLFEPQRRQRARRGKRPKDRDVCFAGRREKLAAELGCPVLTGLPRGEFLDEMARYRRVYAIERTAIEAHVLGCEVLPYDPEFPDPSVWAPLDTADAASMLQGILDGMDD